MSNDDILDLVRQCDLQKGNVLVPGEAYWFKQAFQIRVSGSIRYEEEEIPETDSDDIEEIETEE